MLELDTCEIGTVNHFELASPGVAWDASIGGFVFRLDVKTKIHAELIAGGGGGGGATFRDSGTGGGAGEYKVVELILDPGKYVAKVGAGGNGGESFGKGRPGAPSTGGGASAIYRASTGFLVEDAHGRKAEVRGGDAGGYGAGSGLSGSNGGGIVGNFGQQISTGGAGGAHDRPGKAGVGPGAGSGGCGDYDGPSDYKSANGNDGRIGVTVIARF